MRNVHFSTAAKHLLTALFILVLMLFSTAVQAGGFGRSGSIGSSSSSSFGRSSFSSSSFGRSGSVGSSWGSSSSTRSPSSFGRSGGIGSSWGNSSSTRAPSSFGYSSGGTRSSSYGGTRSFSGGTYHSGGATVVIANPPSTQTDDEGQTWYYYPSDGQYHDTPQGGLLDFNNDGQVSDTELGDMEAFGWWCFGILVGIGIIAWIVTAKNDRDRRKRNRPW